jgi:hypothetical protein
MAVYSTSAGHLAFRRRFNNRTRKDSKRAEPQLVIDRSAAGKMRGRIWRTC